MLHFYIFLIFQQIYKSIFNFFWSNFPLFITIFSFFKEKKEKDFHFYRG
jgi:hypothetical protein